MIRKLVKLLPQKMVVSMWRQLRKIEWLSTVIEVLANVRFVAGVCGLIYNEDGELLVVKHTYKRIVWGLPSGGLERENPADGLVREVREETGFIIEPVMILDVLYTNNPSSLSIIVEAKLLGGVFTPSPEISAYEFINTADTSRLPDKQKAFVKKYGKVL